MMHTSAFTSRSAQWVLFFRIVIIGIFSYRLETQVPSSSVTRLLLSIIVGAGYLEISG